MPRPPRRICAALRRRVRTSLARLAVVGYVLSLFGYPVWTPRDTVVGSPPFPCQSHACGCASADECWRSCCCFTLDQRMAWAKAHGVTPPLEIVQGASVSRRNEDRPKSCCASHQESCSRRDARCESFGAGQNLTARCSSAACSHASKPKTSSVRWVVGIQARKCRGLGTHWLSFDGPAAPPPPRVAWRPQEWAWEAVPRVACTFPDVTYAPPTRPG